MTPMENYFTTSNRRKHSCQRTSAPHETTWYNQNDACWHLSCISQLAASAWIPMLQQWSKREKREGWLIQQHIIKSLNTMAVMKMNRGGRNGTFSICMSCVPKMKNLLIENNDSVLRQMEQTNKKNNKNVLFLFFHAKTRGPNSSCISEFRHNDQKFYFLFIPIGQWFSIDSSQARSRPRAASLWPMSWMCDSTVCAIVWSARVNRLSSPC